MARKSKLVIRLEALDKLRSQFAEFKDVVLNESDPRYDKVCKLVDALPDYVEGALSDDKS